MWIWNLKSKIYANVNPDLDVSASKKLDIQICIHLKKLHQRSMFVATCLDESNQLYSLAIVVIYSKNNDAWEWFMIKLHTVICNKPDLVIIFDWYTSIKRVVLRVFCNATHGICFYHVKGNIKSKFMMSKVVWDNFKPIFINIAKIYGHKEFKK